MWCEHTFFGPFFQQNSKGFIVSNPESQNYLTFIYLFLPSFAPTNLSFASLASDRLATVMPITNIIQIVKRSGEKGHI